LKRIKYNPFLHIHPLLKKEIIREFEKFYEDQKYILGEGLERFEREYAQYCGVKYAIGVGNGHDSLLIILKCLGIGEGDEVILPAHTFIATALSVINVRAKPVLVDIDRTTLNIDPKQIEGKITRNTRAIIPVHLYGNPADITSIQSIATRYNIFLIEDSAQAQGAMLNNKYTGSFGIMNFTSFYPTKNIGALGDGGMITTNSRDLAVKARVYRNYGRSENDNYIIPGINSRLDELQARFLSIKLKYLDEWNNQRTEIANLYQSQLNEITEIQFQTSYPDAKNVRHIFPILTEKRDLLKNYLSANGVETLVHYKNPIHRHESFSFLNLPNGSLPVAERICTNELSLPIYPGLKEEEIVYVCAQIKKFFSSS